MLKASDYNQADIDADGALITSQALVLSDPRSSQDIDKVKQAVGSAVHICASEGCEKEANMVCPTCIKFSAPPTHFCDQECFKKSWNDHKLVHTEIKAARASQEVFVVQHSDSFEHDAFSSLKKAKDFMKSNAGCSLAKNCTDFKNKWFSNGGVGHKIAVLHYFSDLTGRCFAGEKTSDPEAFKSWKKVTSAEKDGSGEIRDFELIIQ
jgi:hypothetical protein